MALDADIDLVPQEEYCIINVPSRVVYFAPAASGCAMQAMDSVMLAVSALVILTSPPLIGNPWHENGGDELVNARFIKAPNPTSYFSYPLVPLLNDRARKVGKGDVKIPSTGALRSGGEAARYERCSDLASPPALETFV